MTSSQDAWATVSRYRDELISNGRKIAFAGAAFGWTLQTNGKFPPLIGISLLFFVLFFCGDLIQLFVGHYNRRKYLRHLERHYYHEGVDTLAADYSFKQSIETWPYRLSLLKWFLLTLAFLSLLYHLWYLVDPLKPVVEILTRYGP